ncbi:MAG: hypothetical protein AABO58_16300 [Acidobacteriota bacterium]
MNKSRFGVRWDVVGGVFGATAGVLLAAAALHSDTPAAPPLTATVAPVAVAPPPPPVDPPPAEPSQSTPTLLEAGNASIELRTNALARELSTMWTRNPNELVRVIDDASRAAPASPSVTLLLAIAHAETNGKILDVSEAGAVGLAQATPIACRQEQVDGKLYVTADYTTGARAYIMKKPLGDADRIATMVLDKFGNQKTLRRAKRLLTAAKSLRREGVDELELLDVWAGDSFFQSIKKMDKHNQRVLKELETLLAKGSKKDLRNFRNRARSEYRALRDKQHRAWMEYEYDLADRRDALLVAHFHERADVVKKTRPYEAGEFLAQELDVRFSPTKQAAFLVRHLERKSEEAQKLAKSKREVEGMTAALYNGGAHNVKRMLAGLIASLPETERYMRKVPATRRRLDGVVAANEAMATPLR